jgi:pimeloyl-ACP methyl ester carboxylesterase
VAEASSCIPRITAVTLVHILRNWGWEKDKVADGEGVIGDWFAKRRRLTVKDLSAVRLILRLFLKPLTNFYLQIRCPVLLIHCKDDLPYPEEGVRETERDMRHAGLNVRFETIPGPHFGSFTNPAPCVFEIFFLIKKWFG